MAQATLGVRGKSWSPQCKEVITLSCEEFGSKRT